MTKWRIKEVTKYNGDVHFFVQFRFLIFFWLEIERVFFTLDDAKAYVARNQDKIIVYHETTS